MCSTASCSALYLPTDNYIERSLYMDDSLYPTIDRAKPNLPSQVYVWDNTCSALDAEWQCLPYALDKCEALRGGTGLRRRRMIAVARIPWPRPMCSAARRCALA